MDRRRNQILLGVILLILGFMSLWQDVFTVYLRAIPFTLLLVGGFAFLLLYRTKRKSWSLVVGGYLVYIAVMTVKIGDFSFFSPLFPAMFFLVPAFVFLTLYFDKHRRGLLLPGFILLWFGFFLIITWFKPLQGVRGFVFFACMGTAFLFSRMTAKPEKKGLSVACALCYLMAVMRLFHMPFFSYILSFMPLIGSVLIIAAAVVIILRAVKK